MTRNENSWGETPAGIDRLIWKPVADDIARASGLKTGGHTPRIWDGMKKRGYSQTDIEKVMGGNWLRVLRDVWGA